jgi:hypothetical protein
MSNKRRIKTVKVVRHNFEGGVEELLDRMKKFAEEWAEKLNAQAKASVQMEDHLKRLSIASAQEFGKLWANQQQFANSIDHVDTNVLVTTKVLREIFGQLQQIDTIFSFMKEAEVPIPEITEEKAKEIKEAAEKWFKGIVAGCFKEFAEEQKAEKAEREAAAKAAAEAVKAKEESARAEEALKKAEEGAVAPPGGQGADIPEGATLFGGES